MGIRCGIAVLAALLLPWGSPSSASAAGRVALVVGNSAYETSPQRNPVNDAEAVGAALARLGFDVTVLRDADEDAMDDALGEFEEASAGADVALLFYAGHGMEMNGANYLIPVDARLESASAVPRETIPLDSVLASMANARTRIAILDACRNNPFARSMRGAARANVRSGGLAAVASGEGLLVAYAAAAGAVADDGDAGGNSPYTTALLEHLERPGVDVRIMLGDVGAAVMTRTGDQQPFISVSLSGEHYLAGAIGTPGGGADAVLAARLQQETAFWQSIANSTDVADFNSYLREYPNGRFAELARSKSAALRDSPPPTGPEPTTAIADRDDLEQVDIARLRLMAGQGDARARIKLGERYMNGRGVARDYGLAVSWFRQAAEQGHASGQAALGFMYGTGRGVARDYGEAVRLYRLAAEQGNARGQAGLGSMYANGYGVARDYGEAARWWHLAAEQGHAVAQNNLGLMYYRGDGVEENYVEAVRWYRLAAEQGHANARYNLGLMYANGNGVEEDYGEAARWWRLAAEQGHAVAQNNLGLMYYRGDGVEENYVEAVRWYRLAAEQGHAEAQNRLGFMYELGRGVEENYVEAVRWYRLAAEQGHAHAQNNLGAMYGAGHGVDHDDGEAVRWYRLAAEQGHAEAQNRLGRMYVYGRGVEEDDVEAVRWYRLAAEQGHAEAQNRLGRMYEYGRGVEEDDEEAARWYRLAAEQGSARAQEALDRLRDR